MLQKIRDFVVEFLKDSVKLHPAFYQQNHPPGS